MRINVALRFNTEQLTATIRFKLFIVTSYDYCSNL